MFLDAAAKNGIALNPDYNGEQQEGSFLYQVTHKNGERCSAAKAYLTPNLNRPNLKVITHAVSAKIELQNRRATGVQFYNANQLQTVRARREVVCQRRRLRLAPVAATLGHWCSGRAAKSAHGIEARHNLPGVGKNLQDHIDYVQSWKVPSNTATFGAMPRGMLKTLAAMWEWRSSVRA
jgi:choline dehydrogenase-like flavoprotein